MALLRVWIDTPNKIEMGKYPKVTGHVSNPISIFSLPCIKFTIKAWLLCCSPNVQAEQMFRVAIDGLEQTLGKQHANSQAARKGLSQIFSICGSLQGMDLGRPLNIWWGWFKNTLAIFPPMVQIERLALCHFNLKDPISVDMCRHV